LDRSRFALKVTPLGTWLWRPQEAKSMAITGYKSRNTAGSSRGPIKTLPMCSIS